jgi:Tol biopolymer transport system component
VALDARGLPQGQPTRLSDSLSVGTATWTRDGREIVFSARRALWRLDARKGGTPLRLPFVGQDGQSPVIARAPDGKQRLVYTRSVSDSNVWRLTVPAPGIPATTGALPAVSSTRDEFTPVVSPDGHRVAFTSNRSGEPQIWTAAVDGSDPRQLTWTAFRSVPGWPRWSPDGRWIAFQGDPEDRPEVLLVPAQGGPVRVLTAGIFSGAFPSFAQDGRSLYFCRWDGPQTRIWKMPEIGDRPVPVTSDPGIVPLESPDGRHLYYVSAADRPSTLWQMPVAGGRPVRIVDGVLYGNFAVVDDGIYYLERVMNHATGDRARGPATARAETRLQFYDLSKSRSITIATDLGMAGHGISASRDGKHIFFARVDSAIDELLLVDDFR